MMDYECAATHKQQLAYIHGGPAARSRRRRRRCSAGAPENFAARVDETTVHTKLLRSLACARAVAAAATAMGLCAAAHAGILGGRRVQPIYTPARRGASAPRRLARSCSRAPASRPVRGRGRWRRRETVREGARLEAATVAAVRLARAV